METEQPLYYHMHVGTITFYLSLTLLVRRSRPFPLPLGGKGRLRLTITLCGQLGSSNQSALFILSYQELVTYTFMIDPSVFTYDTAPQSIEYNYSTGTCAWAVAVSL